MPYVHDPRRGYARPAVHMWPNMVDMVNDGRLPRAKDIEAWNSDTIGGQACSDTPVLAPLSREIDGAQAGLQSPVSSSTQYSHAIRSQPAVGGIHLGSSLRRKTPTGTITGAYQSSLHNPTKYQSMSSVQQRSSRRSHPLRSQRNSVVAQNTTYSPQYVNPLAQSQATVIQYPSQPLGPTASGMDVQGPYGPYWHDGTFVPYRPHAIRDPRYYTTTNQPFQSPTVVFNQPQHYMFRSPDNQSSMAGRPRPVVTPDISTAQFAFHQRQPCSSASSHTPQFNSFQPVDLHAYRLSTYSMASAVPQNRDEIFAHALNAYRALLTSLKTQNHTGHVQHTHPSTRPVVYPRPPTLPIGHSSTANSSKKSYESQPSSATVMLSDLSGLVGRQTTSTELVDISTAQPWQPSAPTARSSACLQHNSDTLPPHDSSVIQANVSRINASSSLTWSPPSLAITATQHAVSHNVISQAQEALNALTHLCLESGWQWTDGVNLAGCLAYGLGFYRQASHLYKHVLTIDTKHVEAMSNLAATMLALGCRTEAEEYWTKAVKQAPSYFEAVEHLIGMLCSSGRGRDAVRIIEHVEQGLRIKYESLLHGGSVTPAESVPGLLSSSEAVYSGCGGTEAHSQPIRRDSGATDLGFGSSGYRIPGCDNGRMIALVHAKGNIMYSQNDYGGAAKAFEDVVLIATGRKFGSVKAVVSHILSIISTAQQPESMPHAATSTTDPVLLYPEQAVQIAKLCFPNKGELPGLSWLTDDPSGLVQRGAILTTSNSLLSLAKIFQDGMSSSASNQHTPQLVSGVREILALYYLSLSLQPSPSTANNVGILLAGVHQSAQSPRWMTNVVPNDSTLPGVSPGSGIALALAYYNYGLILDARHAHLYTNLGSLLKDIGQLDPAIEMYKRAVNCDGKFDIALANLANAVKDKGRISEAIDYYSRAVEVNPDFAEAVCGLANALNSVCLWRSRGGIISRGDQRDRWHVDEQGLLRDARQHGVSSTGWIKRVVDIVEKQLADGEDWGRGTLTPTFTNSLVVHTLGLWPDSGLETSMRETLATWSGQRFEGARLVQLIERISRSTTRQWYHDKYVFRKEKAPICYKRPRLPDTLAIPAAPTVLPFHTFTTPMSANQVRLISQRNGYKISTATLKSSWLSSTVYPPPPPPQNVLKVGYISSDFNNHPLAHLMQSVFGMHDTKRVEAFCYATTVGDNSIHRQQIETESPTFHDASAWSNEKLVSQIVADGIHVLVNLNGYTRGARNDVFAARPAPIQMSFMGFAGTLGAEWCDYLLADSTAIPPSTLRHSRRNVDVMDLFEENKSSDGQAITSNDDGSWVYGENIIYCRSSFFCCDHRQSAPDAKSPRLTWHDEQVARWSLRKELFPSLPETAIIFANFNQLYKIEPTTFRTWLRILAAVPNSILWLLRFPDLGEHNLKQTAHAWAGPEVASRVLFTAVAPKHLHIARAKVVDLFLDTPECNAHTTAADVLWSGTPLLTFPRYEYKMCSRMAASILRGALPRSPAQDRSQAEKELIASSDEEYEALAIELGQGLKYISAYEEGAGQGRVGFGTGRLVQLRKMLTEARWTSDLFDTKRWVTDLEDAYEECWRRWVDGRGGDVYLDQLPKGRVGALPQGSAEQRGYDCDVSSRVGHS